jgi:hypothetical protein
LLSTGAIVAQKASLRSFLKGIEMHLSQVVTDYIILLKTRRNSTFGFFWFPLLQSRRSISLAGRPQRSDPAESKGRLSVAQSRHGLRKDGGRHPGRGRLQRGESP